MPRASYQPQPPSLRINGKQTLFLTIVAGSKLGGSGRAAKSPIKHVDGEYKEIGAAYKEAAGQVSKIEAAPWSATRPKPSRRWQRLSNTGNDYQLDTDIEILTNAFEFLRSLELYLAEEGSGFLKSLFKRIQPIYVISNRIFALECFMNQSQAVSVKTFDHGFREICLLLPRAFSQRTV